MTAFWALDYLCLGLVLASAVLVVFLRSLTGSVMALSAMGTVLGSLFVVLAAPDVALAAVVVGAIAQPVLYLIAIGKLRTDVVDTGDLGESLDDTTGGPGGRDG
jgi:energy-converting hydrogenase B subunit D